MGEAIYYPQDIVSTFVDVYMPSDLLPLILTSQNTLRFADGTYYEGIFFDNVKAHLFRCVIRAQNLILSQILDRNMLVRILWLHDLPETVSSADVTSIAKAADSRLEALLDEEELLFVTRNFTPEDQRLFLHFVVASEFLSVKSSGLKDIFPEALIARVIDIIDNNITFHFLLSRWLQSPRFDLTKIPPLKALEFTFLQYSTMKERILSLDEDNPAKRVCLDLIDKQISSIRSLWLSVNPSRFPENSVLSVIDKGLRGIDISLGILEVIAD